MGHTARMASEDSTVLTRRIIAKAALEMMDAEGYAAFSMPKLGARLGIRTPSLYHHFRDRADLLSEVARMVVTKTDLPPWEGPELWREYFVALAVNFRRTLLAHANTAPVLVQFLPREVMIGLYELSVGRLREVRELPISCHVLILDRMEKLTLGTALIEASVPLDLRDTPFPRLDPERQPHLAAAVAANQLDAEQLFVLSLRAFLDGVVLANGRAGESRSLLKLRRRSS